MTQQPRLPVPDLTETCARYLKQVRPLLSDEEYKKTTASVRHFQSRIGKTLQTQLQTSAEQADTSWLLDAWLKSYLDIRTPLPLASNVGFTIRTHGKSLSEWAAAIAAVCADFHHGRIPVPQTPQGTPACMHQWQILRGAARIPQTGSDGYRIAATANRHIGVLHNGFYYRITALDDNFEAYHPDTFKQAFEQILSDYTCNPYPVAIASYLGGNAAARLYRDLKRKDDNTELAEHIETDLFHISLDDISLSPDEDLARATFQPHQNVWCYKPMTFCYNSSTQNLFLHCEHTWEDGGTLKNIVALAGEKLRTPQGKKTAPAISRHQWNLTPAQKKNWPQWQQQYAGQAVKMRVSSLPVTFNGNTIPKGISHDALMQFMFQYALLTTYGEVRNIYEAVDVSHFRNGRTECVRPISEESLAFVGSLLQEQPDQSLLDAALAEHKTRVKAAKLAQGANRHLLGLKLTAKQNGSSRVPAVFKDKGYEVFTTDFLSTSTLGDDSIIVNFTFAPTSAGGLGINYTLTQDGWLFTASYPEHQKHEVAIFLEALKQGAERLLLFFNPTVKENNKPL